MNDTSWIKQSEGAKCELVDNNSNRQTTTAPLPYVGNLLFLPLLSAFPVSSVLQPAATCGQALSHPLCLKHWALKSIFHFPYQASRWDSEGVNQRTEVNTYSGWFIIPGLGQSKLCELSGLESLVGRIRTVGCQGRPARTWSQCNSHNLHLYSLTYWQCIIYITVFLQQR